MVDGEIVIASGPGLDFEALLQRIHPAASRVDMLATETPAMLIAFDLLAIGDQSLMERPSPSTGPPSRGPGRRRGAVQRTLITDSLRQAEHWFRLFEGAGLDGWSAKPPDLPYLEDQRVMFKVKHRRTAAASSPASARTEGPVVGSLLLGLTRGGRAPGASGCRPRSR